MKSIRSKYIIHFIILILIGICFGCVINDNGSLIILRNSEIEIGILPEIGGRIVLLRKPGFKNILKADTTQWKNPAESKPKISEYSDFTEVGGHITWVGPQSEWWTHQNLNKDRLKKKSDWPPDPYLIYGKNEITLQTDTSIKMIGPKSPLSGVQITKEISISNSGIVTIKSTAQNIRSENVSWDLWMLTRLDGFALAYVPIEEDGILELVKSDNNTIQATPYKIINNYFSFEPTLPVKPKKEQIQEVHLKPSAGFLAGFEKDQLLIIKFDRLNPNLIHPKHGEVELYNYVNKSGEERLLELEIHGAYKTLAPGEMMTLMETWQLFSFKNDKSLAEIYMFLDRFK